MRPLRAAATALVAVLALSSCDGGSDPTDPSPTAKPSESSSVPSTTPPVETPTEPALPPAATKATEAGARAFIAHYFDLINFAQATGMVDALRAVSASTCAACTDLVERLRNQYQVGGRIEGGVNSLTTIKATEVTTTSKSAYGFQLKLDVFHDEQVLTDGDGGTEKREAGTNTFTALIMWTDGRWRLDVLQVG